MNSRKDADHRHGYPEDYPLGLLALGRIGDARVAVELGHGEAAPENEDSHIEESGWPAGRAERRENPRTNEENPTEGHPARPARHESTAGKEVEEQHPRHVADKRHQAAQCRLHGRVHPLGRVRSKDKQPVQRAPHHQHRGDEQRHGIIRATPEDDEGDHREDRDKDGVKGNVVECVSTCGESHLREGGAHPRSGVGKLGVASRDTDYELSERYSSHRQPPHPRENHQAPAQRRRRPRRTGSLPASFSTLLLNSFRHDLTLQYHRLPSVTRTVTMSSSHTTLFEGSSKSPGGEDWVQVSSSRTEEIFRRISGVSKPRRPRVVLR